MAEFHIQDDERVNIPAVLDFPTAPLMDEVAEEDPLQAEWNHLVEYENWINDRFDGIPIGDLPQASSMVMDLRRMKEEEGHADAVNLLLALLTIAEKVTDVMEMVYTYWSRLTGLLYLNSHSSS